MADDLTQVQETAPAQETQAKTYDDKQVNDLIAKNSAKAAEKAQRELLDKYGLKSTEDIDALVKLKQEKMTEAEKQQALLQEKETALAQLRTEKEQALALGEALRKGVPADKVDRVVKLAQGYEGETVAEKISAVLTEFPEFIKAPVKDIGAPSQSQSLTEKDALLETLRRNTGLKK